MAFNKETNKYEGFIYKIVNDVNDKVYIGQTTTSVAERWHGHMSSALNEKRYKSALYGAMRKYSREKFQIIEIGNYEADTKEGLIEILNSEEQKYIEEYKSLVKQNGYNFESGGDNKKVPGRKVNKYDDDLNLLCSYESCKEAGRQNNIDGSTIYSCCKHDYFKAGGYIWFFAEEKPIKPYYKERKKKKIEKKPYISKTLPPEVKRERKLQRIGWNGQRIFQYNAYGELINIFTDIIDASEKLKTDTSEIKKNLLGENLHFRKTVLRNEKDSFDKYQMSKQLQPMTLYDLQGNFVKNFECIIDAEKYLDVPSGEIVKTLKRGGSCKGYLISKYGEPLQRKLYRCEKPVQMCDEYDNIIKEFSSLVDVERYFNTECRKAIRNAIKNKTKYRGYYWKDKEEYPLTA